MHQLRVLKTKTDVILGSRPADRRISIISTTYPVAKQSRESLKSSIKERQFFDKGTILNYFGRMVSEKDLTGYYYTKIVKSLKYFEYTHARVLKLKTNPSELNDQDFEIWDGFATRFSRSADIFLSKYIKAAVLKDDPGFDGSFRDFLNRAEKLKLISDTAPWLEIRALRNVIVHDYSDSDLDIIFKKMLRLSPLIIELRQKLAS